MIRADFLKKGELNWELRFMSWNRLYQEENLNFYFSDVGARDGFEHPWNKHSKTVKTIAFEADKEEFESLKSRNEFYKVYNYALSEGLEPQVLNLLKSRGCSSFLEPNYPFLNMFPDSQRFQTDLSVKVSCESLDHLSEKHNVLQVDFIKLDTQGSELAILKGGAKSLQQCCGVQIEVSFHELYQGQPLFSDVDSYIRKKMDLELYDLRKTYWKYKTEIKANNPKGKLIFGDALYLRRLDCLEDWIKSFSSEELRRNKLINTIFLGYVYGYYDYCLRILEFSFVKELMGEKIYKAIICKVQNNNRDIYSFLPYQWRARIGYRLKFFAQLFRPTHEGWATGGESLGVRKKFGGFIS